MTKKDFKSFADMFNFLRQDIIEFSDTQEERDTRELQLDRVLTSTIQIFMESNKNFSPSKFRQACGIK
jgi:hypothetical protein